MRPLHVSNKTCSISFTEVSVKSHWQDKFHSLIYNDRRWNVSNGSWEKLTIGALGQWVTLTSDHWDIHTYNTTGTAMLDPIVDSLRWMHDFWCLCCNLNYSLFSAIKERLLEGKWLGWTWLQVAGQGLC